MRLVRDIAWKRCFELHMFIVYTKGDYIQQTHLRSNSTE
jgi:hypothetical protein